MNNADANRFDMTQISGGGRSFWSMQVDRTL